MLCRAIFLCSANIAVAISFTTSTQFKRHRNKKHGSFHEEVPVNGKFRGLKFILKWQVTNLCITTVSVNEEVHQHQLVHQEDNTTANMNKMPQQNHAVAIWSNHHHAMIDSDLSFDGDLYAEHFNNPVPESVLIQCPWKTLSGKLLFCSS